MSPIGIGRRNKRVAVQSPSTTIDDYRQETTAWPTVATLWGYVRSPNGREVLVASQREATVEHVVELNHPGSLVTITPEMRLTIGSRVFNVTSVLNVDERNRTLVLGCTERLDETP